MTLAKSLYLSKLWELGLNHRFSNYVPSSFGVLLCWKLQQLVKETLSRWDSGIWAQRSSAFIDLFNLF